MKNQSKARLAGLTGMAGAMLFAFYFISINSLFNLFSTPFSSGSITPIHMNIPCNPGLLLPDATKKNWAKSLAKLNPSIYTLGPTFYIVESIFSYNFSESARQRFFTLIGLGKRDYRSYEY